MGDITGLPLVTNTAVGYPHYARLTSAGIADDAVAGAQLATGVYKENLIVGNVAGSGTAGVDGVGESIRFGESGQGVNATVGIYVNNALRISAKASGGSFTGTWTGSSDDKWKDLLGPISKDPLADLDKVDGETWTWKPGYHFGDGGAFGAGVVAQQFRRICPRAVTFSVEQDGLVVDYNAVHSFNLACIKALKQAVLQARGDHDAHCTMHAQHCAAQARQFADLMREYAALAHRHSALEDRHAALEDKYVALETRYADLAQTQEARLAAVEVALRTRL
jgi:hypothetical protein